MKLSRTKQGSIFPITLVASAIISLIAITGIYIMPVNLIDDEASIHISPDAQTLSIGEEFTVGVAVTSKVPVNVFTGMVLFDPEKLSVVEIDYNTSVADLWTEEPWYKNGEGTIGFAGGTTRGGGFLGTDELMIITFRAISAGDGGVRIEDARILKHDGLGSDADVAKETPTFFTILNSTNTQPVIEKVTSAADVVVVETERHTDLNGDGVTNISDLSMFMLQLSTGNRRSDFNGDGKINASDLSILLQDL